MTAPIKPPIRRPRGRELAAAWLALAAALGMIAVGTALMSLGGYALLATLFGNSEGLAYPWWPVIPGVMLFYAGGAIGQYTANRLRLD